MYQGMFCWRCLIIHKSAHLLPIPLKSGCFRLLFRYQSLCAIDDTNIPSRVWLLHVFPTVWCAHWPHLTRFVSTTPTSPRRNPWSMGTTWKLISSREGPSFLVAICLRVQSLVGEFQQTLYFQKSNPTNDQGSGVIVCWPRPFAHKIWIAYVISFAWHVSRAKLWPLNGLKLAKLHCFASFCPNFQFHGWILVITVAATEGPNVQNRL